MHIRLVSIIVMWASIAHAMPFPVAPMGNLVDRVPRAGLLAWWRGGNNALDSASTNNATWSGTATYAAGIAGNAFDMDGASRASAPLPALNVTADFSVHLFVRIRAAAPAANEYILDQYNIAGDQRSWAVVRRLTTGNVQMFLSTNGAAIALSTAIPASTFEDGEYHALTFVFAASLATYVDGQWLSSAALGRPYQTANNIVIGALPSGNYFAGQIDEVAIYGRALTPNEIALLAAARSYPRERP
jgi:hypothetical protein